eukprot:TRINITY_DN5953_c0_g3_i1.p1 TRINITY_DN5953_c0_g3~~TRINITY_DN5953_c0_g3_i1.p1  ORF type:complete len:234 (-),score=26.27 TRINITY_DN5953_c0_g3_i1:288-932(-)
MACFAAGCFWGVETTLACTPGVISTRVGYIGGHGEHPTYKQVCYENTGHAEAVLVTFDPRIVTYDELLDVFFTSHDPTTKNRQGPDVGSQYRSGIFYYTAEQQVAAGAAIERFRPKFQRRIVTEIAPASAFWNAESYHQKYALQAEHPLLFRSLHLRTVDDLLDSPIAAKLNGYCTGQGTKATEDELAALDLNEETKDLLKSIKFAGPACAYHR